MPRTARLWVDGLAYHVLNRGNRRQQIFSRPADYESCLTTMADGLERVPVRLLSFTLMPNHFHMVFWPNQACEISAYMRWFMNAHIRRHHRFHELWGTGHLYQGRYKAFPIQTGVHLLTVLRYVEANAYRAALVARAEAWPWSSLSRHAAADRRYLLSTGPITRPANWLSMVNEPLPQPVRDALRNSAQRQVGFGDPAWIRSLGCQEATPVVDVRAGAPTGTLNRDTQR
ncbi:MAG: transposase [Acidobacteriota bacterium]